MKERSKTICQQLKEETLQPHVDREQCAKMLD